MIIGSKNSLYNIVLEDIVKQIIIKRFLPGDKITSVREQAKKQKVNPQTVQKAYNMLIEEGIVVSKVGSGNYLTGDNQRIEKLRKEFIGQEIDKFIKIIQEYEIDKKIVMDKLKELDE